MIEITQAIPEGYQSINIYIVVKNAAAAVQFYKQAFGAVEKSRYEFRKGYYITYGSSYIL